MAELDTYVLATPCSQLLDGGYVFRQVCLVQLYD